jgi:hypothetical protein
VLDRTSRNFSRFNIKPEGLFISFDEYQVDCYAVGPSHVLIARNLLNEYLNPKCAVTQLWSEEQLAESDRA